MVGITTGNRTMGTIRIAIVPGSTSGPGTIVGTTITTGTTTCRMRTATGIETGTNIITIGAKTGLKARAKKPQVTCFEPMETERAILSTKQLNC